MMKKIFALVLLLVLGKMSYAQYPITQTLGSDSTIVISKGALQSRLINVTYTDTTAANLQRIRQYPGAQIATTTGGLNLWVRNANATAWIPVATGSGNNIYTIDGALLGNRTLTGAGYSLTFNQLSKLLFNADSTTINTDQATISNNGVSTLSVKGATGRMFLVDTTAPADERIYELKSSNGEFFISILNDAQTSNDSAFLITSASRVGINTLNPDSTLKVGGGVNIVGGLRVGNLPTSPGTKALRINAQGQFSVTDTLIDAGGTVTSIATNNGSGITGGTITTTGTLAIDTTNVIATKASVSGGLAGKLNISDTAAMLAPYLRAIDTASLSNRINTKLNISDTATMLGNYLNNVGYGLSKVGQVASADSATLSAYYLRRQDSLTVTNPLGYVTKKILSDTAAAIRSADAGGTVTSVATNNGTGITGGTITTSGTLAIDTLLVSTRAWRQKGVDSVAALANTKISGSLISGYLTKATGSLTIDTSQLYQSSGLIGIGTTSPTQKLQVSGNAYVNGQLFAGDTALSTYQVEGILSTPYVLGRKAVDNTLSTEARPTGIQGHVVGRGSIANRLQGGTFYATTDSASTANSTGSLRASNSWSAHNGSGTLANAWGSYNIVQNKTTGTITNAYGSVSGVENRGATSTINKLHGTTTEIWNNFGGTVDTAFGQVISIYNNNAASNIGAVYGLSIGKGLVTPTGGTHYWKNLGTIGTSYGLYLDTSIDVGATKYSIFSNSNSNSYFKGKLGVGTTSPDSAFQVATGAYFQRGIRASALPQAPGTKALRIDASGTISYADTLIDAGGTVTSVATNNGTGITGGTITTTGTLAIDTLLISTRAWRQKGVDSIKANYVPYTGATTNVDINTRLLSANSFKANGNGVSSGGYLGFQQYNITTSALSGYTVISALQQNTLNLSYAQIPSGTKTARLSSSLITTDSTYDYNFPNKGGTFAMTSDVTGAVSGTTNYIPKFTSSSAIGNSVIYEASGSIGINTTSPAIQGFNRELTISAGTSGNVRAGISIQGSRTTASTIGALSFYNQSNLVTSIETERGGDDATGTMLFLTNNSGSLAERMRLTSTGLGIGTSSPASYDAGANKLVVAQSGSGGITIATGSSNIGAVYFADGTSGTETYRGFIQYRHSSDQFEFGTSASLKMTLDASGNLGLGVTPSAWNAGGKAIEIGMIGSAHWGLDQTSTYRTTNAYWNSGWKYGGTGQAANYAQEAGSHYWSTAPSGTAGNAITFTQAMTLDASGNLAIGATTNYGSGARLTVQGGPIIAASSTWNNSTTGGAISMFSDNANYGTIWALKDGNQAWGNIAIAPLGGNVGIGTTSPASILHTSVTTNGTSTGALFANPNQAGTADAVSINFGLGRTVDALLFNIPAIKFGKEQQWTSTASTVDGYLSFSTMLNESVGERMRITSTGNVGIGTTSPANALTVVGGEGKGILITANNGAVTLPTTGLSFQTGYGVSYMSSYNSSNVLNDLYFNASSFIFSNASERMRITSSGELLINTTSDAGDYKLQVNGNGYFNGTGNTAVLIRSTNDFPVMQLQDARALGQTWNIENGRNAYGELGFYAASGGVGNALTLAHSTGNATFSGSIKTAAPTGGTAVPWKLGDKLSTSVTLDTGNYIPVEVNGVTYYLALVTLN